MPMSGTSKRGSRRRTFVVAVIRALLAGGLVAAGAGSCRSGSGVRLGAEGSPCDRYDAHCLPGLVCTAPKYINAGQWLCCRPGHACTGKPVAAAPYDAGEFDGYSSAPDAPGPGADAGLPGTCNPSFCPTSGFGNPCCVTPNGPCGVDTGGGCDMPGSADADSGPPACGGGGQPEGNVLVSGFAYPMLVAGDPPVVANHNWVPCVSGGEWVMSCGQCGPDTVTLVGLDGAHLAPTNSSFSVPLIVKTATDVYWTAGDESNDLNRASLSTGATTVLRGTGLFGGLAYDSDYLYWAEAGQKCWPDPYNPYCDACTDTPWELMRAPLPAGAPFTAVYDDIDPGVTDLVVGATDAFFATWSSISAVDKGGAGTARVVDLENPGNLALDATYLYFTAYIDQGQAPADGGADAAEAAGDGGANADADVDAAPAPVLAGWAIGRWPQAGGAVQWLVTGLGPVQALAVDDSHVYWADDATCGSIWRAPVGGGAPEVVASSQPSITSLLVDDENVYWALPADVGGPYGGYLANGVVKSLPKPP